MSIQTAVRNLISEIASLLENIVIVKLIDGTTYEGKLVGIDAGDRLTLHLVLEDAKTSSGEKYYKVVINGSRVSEIISVQRPKFNPEEFAEFITVKLNLPPGTVRVIKEAKTVLVYDRYKITENGVEGSGGMASKLYSLWEEYMESHKK
ncbi:MAG: Lsm family RNA-binding protein [Desulfurococcales archaeon]|nr:Lsm family RNA-binding protein [Desulfurococcales archaeon]